MFFDWKHTKVSNWSRFSLQQKIEFGGNLRRETEFDAVLFGIRKVNNFQSKPDLFLIQELLMLKHPRNSWFFSTLKNEELLKKLLLVLSSATDTREVPISSRNSQIWSFSREKASRQTAAKPKKAAPCFLVSFQRPTTWTRKIAGCGLTSSSSSCLLRLSNLDFLEWSCLLV